VDTAAVHNPSKPLYSAYAPPGPKKKVHFKRSRYTGAHRGRHASEAATDTAANKTGAAGSTGSTAATTGGTTTALGNTATPKNAAASAPAIEKPGKKEKIRFGQAPREALPPAAHPTNGSEQATGQTAGGETGAGNEAEVASNSSSSTDISGAETAAAPVERKTRFADRAREPKAKKVKTPDQVENERAAQQDTSEEAAAQKTQSAPLGLAGDTATKKKAPKVKGDKTRYSDEVNKAKQPAPPPPQTPTPSPLATPGTVPTPTDNAPADSGTAPAAAPPPAQPQP
jgi:peptidyl-prolyl cis-trans isomerase SurA